MGLDIRIPMGLMFFVFGLILAGYGFLSDPAIYARSMGINVNEQWGIVLLVFGAFMLALGVRGSARSRRRAQQATESSVEMEAGRRS